MEIERKHKKVYNTYHLLEVPLFAAFLQGQYIFFLKPQPPTATIREGKARSKGKGTNDNKFYHKTTFHKALEVFSLIYATSRSPEVQRRHIPMSRSFREAFSTSSAKGWKVPQQGQYFLGSPFLFHFFLPMQWSHSGKWDNRTLLLKNIFQSIQDEGKHIKWCCNSCHARSKGKRASSLWFFLFLRWWHWMLIVFAIFVSSPPPTGPLL